MNEQQTNWTKKDFLAYLLIFCMKADFEEKEAEVNFIKSKVGEDVFNKIFKEFSSDNDYSSAQKIQTTFQRLNFGATEKTQLLEDMNELFKVDGKHDLIETSNFFALKRLMSN